MRKWLIPALLAAVASVWTPPLPADSPEPERSAPPAAVSLSNGGQGQSEERGPESRNAVSREARASSRERPRSTTLRSGWRRGWGPGATSEVGGAPRALRGAFSPSGGREERVPERQRAGVGSPRALRGAFSPSGGREERVPERQRAGVGSPRALRDAASGSRGGSARPPAPLQAAGGQEERYARERERMVLEQIEQRGVTNRRVLEAMRAVPRHLFVPEEFRDQAYADHPLPIGLGQTISQPYIVAYMTELLSPDPEDVVLEVGTGSGYQAAVLAPIVKKVYTVEIFQQLGTNARPRIERLGYSNVELKVADGYYGWEEHAPYDAIVVTAAAEHVPPPLLRQLKPGGIMIIPVGNRFQVQTLMLVEKRQDGRTSSRSLIPVRFVPLLGRH